MAVVTLITLFQTMHIAIIILITKGWMFVRSVLTKEDLSSMTMMMALVYMSQSAYFVTAPIPRMQCFIDFWINILAGTILIYVVKQCWQTK